MEDGLAVFAILMGVSLVVFVFVVMPIWILMHYRHRARQEPAVAPVGFSPNDANDLLSTADRMEQRVAALEAIMDSEAPGWRSKS